MTYIIIVPYTSGQWKMYPIWQKIMNTQKRLHTGCRESDFYALPLYHYRFFMPAWIWPQMKCSTTNGTRIYGIREAVTKTRSREVLSWIWSSFSSACPTSAMSKISSTKKAYDVKCDNPLVCGQQVKEQSCDFTLVEVSLVPELGLSGALDENSQDSTS